jgi:two-component system phosphate regulon sensor histidine kinase PhoR
MNKSMRQELFLLAISIFAALIIGAMIGNIILTLLVVVSAYLAWSLYNTDRLVKWLHKPSKNVPESSGIWDDIFRQTYQQYQRQRKARRKLTAMLTRFQESTRALPYSTIVLNKYDEIEWFNPAARTLFNLHSNHDVGQNIINLIRHPSFADYLRQRKFSKPLEIDMAGRNLVFNITPYGSGQNLVITRDTTQSKQIDTMRRDFIANASHELRTPITVIVGFLEILQEKAPEDLRQPIESIQRQTDRMQRLLLELLELAKLESETSIENPQQINLRAILEDLYSDALSMDNGRHKITLEAEDTWIEGNADEICIAISNLITNAIRYTPDGKRIDIRLEHRNEDVCIMLKDEGIGIEAEHIPRLTERFYRVDPGRSREQGGTGLGLAIVKHVLERHNGYLSIDSRPGHGSTFRCCFPESSEQDEILPDVIQS